ncbi:MAG: tRNA adenosine(34) deaminase TadA [Planctomycetota bacterium]
MDAHWTQPMVDASARIDRVAGDFLVANGLVAGREADAATAARSATDEYWMDRALEEARAAERDDEVPIGAVLVVGDRCIASARNRTHGRRDPTAHAEILAVADAARSLGALRIPEAVVYTTVEPCFMCAGALLHARVARVVWAVRDPKFGGCASLGRVLSDTRANHRVEITEGVRASEARELLQQFFRKKRAAAV